MDPPIPNLGCLESREPYTPTTTDAVRFKSLSIWVVLCGSLSHRRLTNPEKRRVEIEVFEAPLVAKSNQLVQGDSLPACLLCLGQLTLQLEKRKFTVAAAGDQ